MTERFPASTARDTRSARPTSRVQIDPESPYSVSLAIRTASASSSNGTTASTGPKISSRNTRESGDGVSTVGGNHQPGPSGAVPRKATRASSSARKPATESRCAAETSGPIRVPSSHGSPQAKSRTAGSSSSRNLSSTERWTSTRERAQQSWPALSRAPAGADAAACSRSASAKTMLEFFPPSSRVRRLTCSAQPAMIRRPTSVEPVNTTLRTAGWVTKRSPTTEPLPGSTVSTPSGRPASSASSPSRIAVSGVSSAGLSTTVLPAASAGAKPHAAIGMGKFQGTITPTTPRGSWKVRLTPPWTGICRPESRSGAPE